MTRGAEQEGPETPLPPDNVQSTENSESKATLLTTKNAGKVHPEEPQPHYAMAGGSGVPSQADNQGSGHHGSSSATDITSNQVVRQDAPQLAPETPPTGPTSVVFTSGGTSTYPSLTGMAMAPSGLPDSHFGINSRHPLTLNMVRDLAFAQWGGLTSIVEIERG